MGGSIVKEDEPMTGNVDPEPEDESPPSPEWTAEIRRRIEAFKRGEIKTTSAEEVMRLLADRDKP